jgi:hypothetical protein
MPFWKNANLIFRNTLNSLKEDGTILKRVQNTTGVGCELHPT